jgi:hypothetical protein
MVFLLPVLAGCAEETTSPSLVEPTGFVTYTHPTGVFSLELPPDWVVNDASDSSALDVEFSPPGSPEPLIEVYVISQRMLDVAEIEVEPEPEAEADDGSGGEGELINLEPYVAVYRETFYSADKMPGFKEIARDVQPDGSLRIKFLNDGPQGTTQHNDFIQISGSYFVALQTTLPEDTGQLRTLNRILNTLTISKDATWGSLVEEGTESGTQDTVGFASLNAWVDRNGGFEIVGQVINNANAPLEFVRINAQLFDSENRLLVEQDDFVSSDLIAPGEYAPFSIVFGDGLPPGTTRYDLQVSARYADYTVQSFYGSENFALSSQADFDDNGLLVISGQVRNEGPKTANLVKVIVAVFDDQQRVIATDTTLVDSQRLLPGETSAFSVTFVELGGVPNTFLVTTQGVLEE